MTFRSVTVGTVLAAVLCLLTVLLRQDIMGPGFMPAGVFSILILITLAYNPLGRRLKGWDFSGKELAVITMLMLAGGSAPGLLGGNLDMAILPHALAPTHTDWKKARVLDQLPAAMLAETTRQPSCDPLQDYIDGKGTPEQHIGLGEVPWYAWQRPLAFYLPLIAAVTLACLGMALVVHQQWSAHERLSYPIATFVGLLIPDGGKGRGVMGRGSFWVAAGIVVAILLFNYASSWLHWSAIPLELPFAPLFERSDIYMAGNAAPALTSPKILFLVVGLAYLLSSDLSLSMGIGPLLFTFIIGWLQVMGITVQGGVMEPDRTQFLYAGAWAGTVIILLYLGRRFYWDTLRSALFIPVTRTPPVFAVWGLRLLIAASAAAVVLLSGIGINWLLGSLFVIASLSIALVFTRLVSETGVYLIQAYVFPGITMLGFLGLAAMGQENYLVLSILGAGAMGSGFIVLVGQGLRLTELKGVEAGRSGMAAGAAVLLCLALAVPLFFLNRYDKGVGEETKKGGFASIEWPINGAIKVQQDLKFTGNKIWHRPEGVMDVLGKIKAHRDLLAAFAITAGLVIVFSAARIRFAWWPLHPAMFLVFVTFYAQWLAGSFLLGWAIKSGVTRFGGAKSYENIKPTMMGLIAGEVIFEMLKMVIGTATGYRPA
ncbi:MAG: hypothetical protein LLG01_03015 [Planctomycetaceae bacterium]|nr:hypothetical protein [Planctomycetaceae bacterium]